MQTERKFKLLFINVPPGGGAINALYEMTKALQITGISISILCFYKSHYTQVLETIPGVSVVFPDQELIKKFNRKKGGSGLFNFILAQIKPLSEYFWLNRKLIDHIVSLIKNIEPDLIHHNGDIMTNRIAVRAALKLKKPQVLHNRSYISYRFQYLQYLIDRHLFSKIDCSINITKSVADHYAALFYDPGAKAYVLHDIVDCDKFRPLAVPGDLRTQFGIDQDTFVITFIGRLTEWKGQHIALKAFSKVNKQFRNSRLLVIGTHENGIGSEGYYQRLLEIVKEENLSDAVVFTGNRSDIPEIINISDLILNTTVRPEPQGLVIVESLLCGKTVIASDQGGARELIEKYGGILIKPSDNDSLADTIIEIIISGEKQSGTLRGKINSERLFADFNKQDQVNFFIGLYNSLI